jgi:hypothetical protein
MTKLKMLLVAFIAALTLGACAGMNMNTTTAPMGDSGGFPVGSHDQTPD